MGRVRKVTIDLALLIGSALLLIGLGVGSFALSDRYHLSDVWVFATWIGIFFVLVIGRSLRSKFRHPMFVAFFIVWLAIHITVIFIVLKYLTILFVYPFIFLDLWIGYALAFWLFGLPSKDKK